MASEFTRECSEVPCQGTSCTRTTGVTYRVEENQALCDECVVKKAGSTKPRLDWICEEHDEPIKYFCISHNTVACQLCVTIFHQGCQFDAAKTVLKTIKQTLEEIQGRAPQRVSSFEKRRHRFRKMKEEVDAHLTLVEEDVRVVIEEEVKKEKENMEVRALEIQREAEEDIKKIKARMVEKLRINQDEGEAQRQLLERKRSLLLSDGKKYVNDYDAFVEELMNRLKEQSNSLQEEIQRIELLCEQEDREILDGSQELVAATTELLQEDHVDEICEERTRQAKTLRFFHSEHKSVAEGRIDGFYGLWNLEEKIPIVPENMDMLTICGYLNDDDVVFREINGKDLYLANLKTKEITIVEHEGRGTIGIEECVRLNKHQVVCLNVRNWREPNRGDTGDHFISVFDMSSWQLINDLPCPWTSEYERSHIDVDIEGNVLAAREGERVVHIINRRENTMSQTTPWSDQNGIIMGKIYALPTGDIAAAILDRSGYHKFSIIDRAGTIKFGVQDRDWNFSGRFMADPLTEMFYVTYIDKGVKSVDQVSIAATFKVKKIVDINLKQGCGHATHSYIIASGRLVTTDGENILVYKK